MNVLAIDPGSEQSAFLILNGTPREFGKIDNDKMLSWLRAIDAHEFCGLAIETMKPRGMPTSFEEMQTQFWAGRFVEAFDGPFHQVFRMDVKLHLCGRTTAKDSNIRAALIDRYGGKEKAIGKKANRGPLYGISADCWSALAIATTYSDKRLMKGPE